MTTKLTKWKVKSMEIIYIVQIFATIFGVPGSRSFRFISISLVYKDPNISTHCDEKHSVVVRHGMKARIFR